MNFYKLFYWITIAEKLQDFTLAIAIASTVIMILTFIIWIVCKTYAMDMDYSETVRGKNASFAKVYGRIGKITISIFAIFWLLYIGLPSKSDTLLIIAGGAVGNFVTNDSSSKAIPSEITMFLREKIKSEIEEVHLKDMITPDTLKSKTKEELIELLKQKKE